MEKLLITGITGRTGKYFGEHLINNNYPALALIRNKEKFDKLFGNQTVIGGIVGNIEDYNNLLTILQDNKITTIFHIYNIKHSLNIVKAAINSQCVKRLILVHTTGIYSKFKSASSEYIEIEKQIKMLLYGTSIDVTILRPTMIYGSLDDNNMAKFIKMVDKLRVFPLVNGGKYELQPVHQSDLGKAYYQVLTNPEITKNKNYTLSGNDVIFLKDILLNISNFLGKKTFFFNIPYWFAYSCAILARYISLGKIDYRERVQRLVEPRAYSNEEAKKDFGYEPIEFLRGLKEEVETYIKK